MSILLKAAGKGQHRRSRCFGYRASQTDNRLHRISYLCHKSGNRISFSRPVFGCRIFAATCLERKSAS